MSEFEIIARSDVPLTVGKGRPNSGLASHLRQLQAGQALRIAINGRGPKGLQSWVGRRGREIGVRVTTTKDAEYVYVWLKESSE